MVGLDLGIPCQEQIPFKFQSDCRYGLGISGSQGLDIFRSIADTSD